MEKGDNEMFLFIFLWRSGAIVMKLGSYLPYCPGLRFQLKEINYDWQVVNYSCESMPCWHEQKNQIIEDKTLSNDRRELKSCTMNNVDTGNRNLTGVSEIDAWLIIYSWEWTYDEISNYAVRNGQTVMKTTILDNSWSRISNMTMFFENDVLLINY